MPKNPGPTRCQSQQRIGRVNRAILLFCPDHQFYQDIPLLQLVQTFFHEQEILQGRNHLQLKMTSEYLAVQRLGYSLRPIYISKHLHQNFVVIANVLRQRRRKHGLFQRIAVFTIMGKNHTQQCRICDGESTGSLQTRHKTML